MDAYFLVVAILVLLLIISLFYNFSYSNGFGPNNHTLNQPITQAKESEEASKRMVTRKTVSTQSDFKNGSDELDKSDEDNGDKVNETKTGETTNEDDTTEQNDEDDETEINTFRSFVKEDVLIQSMKKKGVFRGLCQFIEESVNKWKAIKIEIAIAGNSGTGKSSLINSLRGLKAYDVGAAAVDVTETTTEPVRYKFPYTDRICISDLPGMGTVKFPREKYFEKMEISKYDAFIIVASGRITQDDVWFARHVLQGSNPKKVLFVRTKIDVDLRNAEDDDPSKFNRDTCLSRIRGEICSNFKNNEFKWLRENIFLISSRQKDQFDFQRLTSQLKNLSNRSGRSIRKILEKKVYDFIEKKGDLNKGEFLGRKVAAFFCGFLPKKYNVLESSKEIQSICKSKFGLDDKSLQAVSKEFGIDVNDLKSNMLTFKQSEVEPPFKSANGGWGIHEYHAIQMNLSTTCDKMCVDEKYIVDLKLKAFEEDICPHLCV